jgi:hypothetical protein
VDALLWAWSLIEWRVPYPLSLLCIVAAGGCWLGGMNHSSRVVSICPYVAKSGLHSVRPDPVGAPAGVRQIANIVAVLQLSAQRVRPALRASQLTRVAGGGLGL